MNLIAIFAVVNITWAGVKTRPQKIQACTGFEPMTSAIPVQCFTNYPFSIKILKDPSPRGSRTSGSFPLPRIPFRISVCATEKVSITSLPISKILEIIVLTCSLIQKSKIRPIFSFSYHLFMYCSPLGPLRYQMRLRDRDSEEKNAFCGMKVLVHSPLQPSSVDILSSAIASSHMATSLSTTSAWTPPSIRPIRKEE